MWFPYSTNAPESIKTTHHPPWTGDHQSFEASTVQWENLRPSSSCCFSVVAGCVWLLHVNQWHSSVNHCYPDTWRGWLFGGFWGPKIVEIPRLQGAMLLGFFDFVVVRRCLANQTSGEVFLKKRTARKDPWRWMVGRWHFLLGPFRLPSVRFVVLLASGSCNPLKVI